jgi:RNase H-fold protein (predicted Holliday junction resolvase)
MRAEQTNVYFARALKEVISKHAVAGVIIGWPVDPFGRQGMQCANVKKFIDVCTSESVRI